MTNRVLHTDAPLMPLTQMVHDQALIWPGQAAGGRRDCFYGWGEPMADAVHCKQHQIVSTDDDVFLIDLAQTVVAAGYQAVISNRDVWSEEQTVIKYDAHHQH